jgi:hypothetical protein
VIEQGGKLYFATGETTVKYKQIQANPNVAICQGYLRLHGVATVLPLAGNEAIIQKLKQSFPAAEGFFDAPCTVLVEIKPKVVLTSTCGADCAGCKEVVHCNGSCFETKGKPCYIAALGMEICEIYDCAINKKGYSSCAECAELPCKIFMGWRDPQMTDEEFQESVDSRVATLKASL